MTRSRLMIPIRSAARWTMRVMMLLLLILAVATGVLWWRSYTAWDTYVSDWPGYGFGVTSCDGIFEWNVRLTSGYMERYSRPTCGWTTSAAFEPWKDFKVVNHPLPVAGGWDFGSPVITTSKPAYSIMMVPPDRFEITPTSVEPVRGTERIAGPRPTAPEQYAVLYVAHWILATAFSLPPLTWSLFASVHLLRRRRLSVVGKCPACGYDLRATPDRCPECGRMAAGVVAMNSKVGCGPLDRSHSETILKRSEFN